MYPTSVINLIYHLSFLATYLKLLYKCYMQTHTRGQRLDKQKKPSLCDFQLL